jgi:hypothetical protein
LAIDFSTGVEARRHRRILCHIRAEDDHLSHVEIATWQLSFLQELKLEDIDAATESLQESKLEDIDAATARRYWLDH